MSDRKTSPEAPCSDPQPTGASAPVGAVSWGHVTPDVVDLFKRHGRHTVTDGALMHSVTEALVAERARGRAGRDDERDHADHDLRCEYGARLGILVSDVPPCWDDIVGAARKLGVAEGMERAADLLRPDYPDAVAAIVRRARSAAKSPPAVELGPRVGDRVTAENVGRLRAGTRIDEEGSQWTAAKVGPNEWRSARGYTYDDDAVCDGVHHIAYLPPATSGEE